MTALELVSPTSALTFPRGRHLERALTRPGRWVGDRGGPDGMGEQHKAGGRQAGGALQLYLRGS